MRSGSGASIALAVLSVMVFYSVKMHGLMPGRAFMGRMSSSFSGVSLRPATPAIIPSNLRRGLAVEAKIYVVILINSLLVNYD